MSIEFEKNPPEWKASGTEPPDSLKNSGFVAGYKPPAEYFNWFWNKTYSCLKELQEKIKTAVVHTTGNQTVAGTKTFTDSPKVDRINPYIDLVQTDITKGTAPSVTSYAGVRFSDSLGVDNDDARMALLIHNYYNTGASHLKMQVMKPEEDSTEIAELVVGYASDGTPYASAPTPPNENDNSTKVATTKWVKTNLGKYLPLAGGTMDAQAPINFGTSGMAIKEDSSEDLLIGDSTNGVLARFCSINSESNPGGFQFRAKNADGSAYLIGKPDGTLTWAGSNIVRSVNGVKADSGGNVDLLTDFENMKILINENTFRNKALASAMVNVIRTLFVEVFGDTTDVDVSKGDGSTAISKYFNSNTHVFKKTDAGTVTIYSKAKSVTSGNNTAWVYGDYTLNGGSIEFAISRDGGTTFTVLTDKAVTSISSQPAGTSMVMRVKMTGAVVFNNIAWGCK